MSGVAPIPRLDGSAAEAAAYWDARLRNPDCTAAERAAFEAWRAAAPENALAFEKLQDGLEALRAAASRPALRALRDDALRQRRPIMGWASGLAATVAIGLVIGWLALPPETQRDVMETAGLAEPAPPPPAAEARAFATAVGGRSTITLSDGSRVTLNTQSRIEEHFSPGRRDVTLVAGQALFEVAHDAARPFVVTAGDRQVTAIGTEFDVRLDPAGMRVVLIEGRVAVEARSRSLLERVTGGGRSELTAGQEFVSNAKAAALVRPADVNAAILWRDGRVAFNDVPLPEAVAEMNRYAAGAQIVADPAMARLRVNGVFRTAEPAAFVRALEAYFPVAARAQAGGDTLLVWRE